MRNVQQLINPLCQRLFFFLRLSRLLSQIALGESQFTKKKKSTQTSTYTINVLYMMQDEHSKNAVCGFKIFHTLLNKKCVIRQDWPHIRQPYDLIFRLFTQVWYSLHHHRIIFLQLQCFTDIHNSIHSAAAAVPQMERNTQECRCKTEILQKSLPSFPALPL